MRKLLAALVLIALPIGALFLPTGERCEMVDVSEVIYSVSSFPTIDLDPPPVQVEMAITGRELVDQLGWLVPGTGPDRAVLLLENDMILVSGTTFQRFAVRTAVAGRRLRNETCQAIAVGIYHLKTTLPKKLFGILFAGFFF